MPKGRRQEPEKYNPVSNEPDPHNRGMARKGMFKKELLPANNFEVDLITGQRKDPSAVAAPPIGTAHHKINTFHYESSGYNIISNEKQEPVARPPPRQNAQLDMAAGRMEDRGSEIDPITGKFRQDPSTGAEIPVAAPRATAGTYRKEMEAIHKNVHPILGTIVDPQPAAGKGSTLGVMRKEMALHKDLDPILGQPKQAIVKSSSTEKKSRLDLDRLNGDAVKAAHQKSFNIISNDSVDA